MILLDTNVLSALMLDQPDQIVLEWMNQQPHISIWTTSVTIYEIRYGLRAMPAGKRRTQRMDAFERLLDEVIEGRSISFDSAAAEYSAELAAAREKQGRPGELRDTMIAGIVLANNAKLATRNVRHFAEIAKSVVNPWAE